jgi:hypothetical protein
MHRLAAAERNGDDAAAAAAEIDRDHANYGAADAEDLRGIQAHREKQIGEPLDVLAGRREPHIKTSIY